MGLIVKVAKDCGSCLLTPFAHAEKERGCLQRRTIKQMVACVCPMNHYKGNIKGTGCRECTGRRADDLLFMAGRQPCLTCSCYCMALFPLDEASTISKYIQDEKDGILPQENVDKTGA